ncbi:MAG: hypothetical protein QOF89_4714 [Acidobacteriota bacterium]|nr:hypothetical protein [Acidobacteriota bacterium]
MRLFLGLIGIGLILLVVFDVIWTTLRLAGAGPLTSWVTDALWRLSLRVTSTHQGLALAGFSVVLFTVSLWLGLDWLGWTLVLGLDPGAVVASQGGQPAGFLERAYFAGSLLITLSNNDYKANGLGWQLVTNIAAANGFTLVSLIITYLLPLVSGVRQRREIAVYLSTLGRSPQDILLRAWNGSDFGRLPDHLVALTMPMVSLGQGHLAYPVLHCFHSPDREAAIAPSLAMLDESLTLLEGVAPDLRPDPVTLYPLQGAIEQLLATLEEAHVEPESVPPKPSSLEALRQAGIRTESDEEMERRVATLSRRRRLLLGLVEEEGWQWRDVMEAENKKSRK